MNGGAIDYAAVGAIARAFQIEGDVRAVRPWGSGHIHDTFRIDVVDTAGLPVANGYLLQRINHYVFREPERLMENIVRVTGHLASALRVIPTREGRALHRDAAGGYWRLYPFIGGTMTCDVVETAAQAREAGLAFGDFLRRLADLPGPPLQAIIPGFHDGPARYRAFEHAVAANRAGRAARVQPEIAALRARAWVFDVLPHAVARGSIPIRITHNDTKLNNVLLDQTSGRAVCVIDLDTVMPGLVAYDFGDLVRTAAATAPEDERDLERMTIDLERFAALAQGYLEGCGGILTPAERAHLVHGGKMMTLSMAVRFMTDYLEGDVYYKTARPGHNLDRARAQLRLAEAIEAREAVMNDLLARIG